MMDARKDGGVFNMKYRDIEFEASQISIDTRTLQPGDVYIAIQGEAQDGHNYVQAAKEKGAIAAIVSRKML